MPAETKTTEPNTEAQAGAPAQDEARMKRRRRRIRALRSLLLKIGALALVLYILLFHLVGIMIMPVGDMSPRLDAGDLILFYRINPVPKLQEVIVIDKAAETDGQAAEPGFFRRALNWLGFADPNAPTTRYVCRVIAAPGDTVDITDERGLTVNNNSVSEPMIFYPTRPYEGQKEFPIVLGEGEYFVLSDYRNGGADSRFFGPVKQEEITGIVITILRRNHL